MLLCKLFLFTLTDATNYNDRCKICFNYWIFSKNMKLKYLFIYPHLNLTKLSRGTRYGGVWQQVTWLWWHAQIVYRHPYRHSIIIFCASFLPKFYCKFPLLILNFDNKVTAGQFWVPPGLMALKLQLQD